MKPPRTPLLEGRPYLVVFCPSCGEPFPTQHRAVYCSNACERRSWRAYVKLAGTHDGMGRRRVTS